MRFLSVCSGIEAASVAWSPIGWTAVAFSEIEPFPCAVLAHQYPDTPNWGDMTKYKEWPDVSIDLLCGGTPCQSFSVAGFRKGLDDPRGNLMLTFGSIAAKYRPKWLVWENVPGVLSSNRGRDFGAFLGMLGQLGYGFAYRVLDAQYFGVAQRRRRVFVVGCLGGWRAAAAVLFERHSMSGHPAPSREARKDVAPTLSARTKGGGGLGTDFDLDGGSIAFPGRMSGTQCAASLDVAPSMGASNPTAVAFNFHKSGNAGSGLGIAEGRTDCLRADTKAPFAVAWSEELTASIDVAGTIQRGGNGGRHDGVMTASSQVRRLTPRECERLQGFPDDYTLIPYRNKPAADGPRYKALGNSWAVPNVRWIGERINAFESLTEAA